MPGMSGLDALQRLRSDGSALPCLFVTTFGEDDYIAEAIRLDADGFVLKSGDPRQLIAGVHAVAGRGAFFSPSVARRLLDSGVSTTYTQYASAEIGRASWRERGEGEWGSGAGGCTNRQSSDS